MVIRLYANQLATYSLGAHENNPVSLRVPPISTIQWLSTQIESRLRSFTFSSKPTPLLAMTLYRFFITIPSVQSLGLIISGACRRVGVLSFQVRTNEHFLYFCLSMKSSVSLGVALRSRSTDSTLYSLQKNYTTLGVSTNQFLID